MGENESEGETVIPAVLRERNSHFAFSWSSWRGGGVQDIVFKAPALSASSASVHTAFIRFLGFGSVR